MDKRLLTPLGEIQIYIDDICSDYEYEKYSKDICSLRECIRRSPAAAGAVVNGSSAVTAAAV